MKTLEDYLTEALRDDEEPCRVHAPEAGEPLRHEELATLAALLVPHWRETRRHQLSLALSAWLARNDVPERDAAELIAHVAQVAADDELRDRLRAVHDTYEAVRKRETVRGESDLHELLPPAVWRALRAVIEPSLTRTGNQAPRSSDQAPHTPFSEVPPFPIETLPPVAANYVREAAASLNVPVDFVATPMLAVLAAAIGASHVLQVRDDWSEPSVLFTCVVGDPGSNKTAAWRSAIAPLLELQAEFDAAYAEELAAYKERLQLYEQELAIWRKRPKSQVDEPKPTEPPKPRPQQVVADDITIEGLARVLRDNPRGLLVARDELVGWVLSFNQYRRAGDDRQRWLQAWRTLPWRINRATRDEPIIVTRPTISLAGTMPPDTLSLLQDERQDGFIDRILFTYPDPAHYAWPEHGIPPDTQRAYFGLVNKLYELSPACVTPVEWVPRVVRLSPTALRLFAQHDLEWHRLMEAELALKGMYAKVPSHAARLCLVLHLATAVSSGSTNGLVQPETVEAAWRLAQYFAAHGRRVRERMTMNSRDVAYLRFVTWLQQTTSESVSARELVHKHFVKTTREAELLFQRASEAGLGHYVVETRHGQRSPRFYRRIDPRTP